jgi:succinate-semialdehyde dehydrogenase/glutarate-semialdehyde dehydrogenase
MFTSINPATGARIQDYPSHTDADIDTALSGAANAQTAWGTVPVEKRVDLLRSMAHQLREHKVAYSKLITAEMGKPIIEAEGEIDKCAATCDFYADEAPKFLAEDVIASNASHSSIVYDPLGVVLAIMPWNYPFWQFIRFAAPALAAGNGVILKHAANVPGCALALEQMMTNAGCPDGLMRALLIESGQVAGIIADGRIAAVTMTGSTQVGQIVAAQSGAALKKQVLELGGSDPFIVLADADVAEAAKTAVSARFINGGQSCVNGKRFIVEDAVADDFIALFLQGIKDLVVGDPTDRATQIGPMARVGLMETIAQQVDGSTAAGARVLCGGHRLEGPGFYYAPTLLDNVSEEMIAFKEELFGPVASIIRARSADHAIELANNSEFGLGAALWTTDLAAARGYARRIEAGAVFINGMVASDARLPFGGIKKSGYGRELGSLGIREFTNIKTLWVGPKQ